MRLGPVLERARTATDLKFNADIRPTIEQSRCANFQLQVHIIRKTLSMYTHLPVFGIIRAVFVHSYYLDTPFPKLIYLTKLADTSEGISR